MHPVTVFIERFRAAVSVLIGPCCPALLNRTHANVYTVVLLGKINDELRTQVSDTSRSASSTCTICYKKKRVGGNGH